jgi:hypothetical protein
MPEDGILNGHLRENLKYYTGTYFIGGCVDSSVDLGTVE